ncbi:MAG: hypothetical protein AAF725_05410 [Acidobacteriota bacterium]
MTGSSRALADRPGRDWWPIFRLEIERLWILWPAALILGLISLLSAAMAGQMGFEAEQTRDITASVSALILAVLTLIGLGSSLLASDLRSGELGFFLARPVSASALWFSRLAARVTLVAGVLFFALAPAMAVGGRPVGTLLDTLESEIPTPFLGTLPAPWVWFETVGQLIGLTPEYRRLLEPGLLPSLGVLAAAALLFYNLASVASQRPRWRTLVDLIAGAAVVLALVGTFVRVVPVDAGTLLLRGFASLILALLLVCALSGWLQIRWAGGDPNRSHRVLSLLVWGTAALVLLGLEGALRRAEGLGLRDFDRLVDVVPAPSGSWLLLTAAMSSFDRVTSFAYHLESGEEIRLGPRQTLERAPVFSADGTRLVWRDSILPHPSWLDLDAEPLEIRALPSVAASPQAHIAVDAEGRQAAFLEGRRVELVDLESGRVLWTQTLPAVTEEKRAWTHIRFDSGSPSVRVTRQHEGQGESVFDHITEAWTLEAGRPPRLEGAITSTWGRFRYLSEDRLLLRHHERDPLIVDLGLRPTNALPPSRLPFLSRSAFRSLSDGSLFLLRLQNLKLRYELLTPRKALASQTADPETANLETANPGIREAKVDAEKLEPEASHIAGTFYGWVYAGGEPDPGNLLLGFGKSVHHYVIREWPTGWRTRVLDTSSGEFRFNIEDHAPLLLPLGPNSLGADWLIGPLGYPHRLDLGSGELTPVLPFGPASGEG